MSRAMWFECGAIFGLLVAFGCFFLAQWWVGGDPE